MCLSVVDTDWIRVGRDLASFKSHVLARSVAPHDLDMLARLVMDRRFVLDHLADQGMVAVFS